jgi:hypothetical protein
MDEKESKSSKRQKTDDMEVDSEMKDSQDADESTPVVLPSTAEVIASSVLTDDLSDVSFLVFSIFLCSLF